MCVVIYQTLVAINRAVENQQENNKQRQKVMLNWFIVIVCFVKFNWRKYFSIVFTPQVHVRQFDYYFPTIQYITISLLRLFTSGFKIKISFSWCGETVELRCDRFSTPPRPLNLRKRSSVCMISRCRLEVVQQVDFILRFIYSEKDLIKFVLRGN